MYWALLVPCTGVVVQLLSVAPTDVLMLVPVPLDDVDDPPLLVVDESLWP